MMTVRNLFIKRDKNGNPVQNKVNDIPKMEDVRVIEYEQDNQKKYKLSVRDYGFLTYSLLENGLDEDVFVNYVIDGCKYEIKPLEKVIDYEDFTEYDMARYKEMTDYCSNMLKSIESNLNESAKKRVLKR